MDEYEKKLKDSESLLLSRISTFNSEKEKF